MKMIDELYEDLWMGDKISDQDLVRLAHAFKDADNALKRLGPKFHIAWAETVNRYEQCRHFINARGLKFDK